MAPTTLSLRLISTDQKWGGRPRPRQTPWSGSSVVQAGRPGGRPRANGPAPIRSTPSGFGCSFAAYRFLNLDVVESGLQRVPRQGGALHARRVVPHAAKNHQL